jgi:hypothetical protein
VTFGANLRDRLPTGPGQQEFDFMKMLLVAASMAAGLAAGAVPAFAQSVTIRQPGSTASAANGAAGSVQAQNHYGAQVPLGDPAQVPISNDAHIGSGSGPDYLAHQRELQNMPGYNIGGNG